MIKLPLPAQSFNDTYTSCINDIPDNDIAYKNKIRNIQAALFNESNLYVMRAPLNELHLFTPSRHAHPDDVAIIDGNFTATKGDLVKLYKIFSNASSNSRAIYDQIRTSSAEHCSMCIVGHVTTLDHCLPKARYPSFSVEPTNLVPTCADCNKGKGSSLISSKADHVLHPYFSDQKFYDENWISARVIESIPTIIRFYVDAPDNWSDDDKILVKNHFNSFKLSSCYSLYISSHLTTAIDTVETMLQDRTKTIIDIKNHFSEMAAKRSNLNSPVRVMFQALSQSDWFCESPRRHNNLNYL